MTVPFPRAVRNSSFGNKKVISSSPWEFVSLWLEQNAPNSRAKIYWEQASQFFASARDLPAQSAPLPLYYSFMNATKALLEAKSLPYSSHHGVSGSGSPQKRIQLSREGVVIKNSGVLPSLIDYIGDTEIEKRYTLTDIISNLPFVHRAYSIVFNKPEIFISIKEPRYVTDDSGHAWFRANISGEFSRGQITRTFPGGMKYHPTSTRDYVESQSRFPWSSSRKPTQADMDSLQNFHRKIRRNIVYISGIQPYWYLKRELKSYRLIDRDSVILIFMAMHRMSEIARYKPVELDELLKSKYNWLLYDFVRTAQKQFIDEIAAEITGYEISPAGVRQGTFE